MVMWTKSNVAIKFSNGDMQENQMLLPIDIDSNTFLCIREKKKEQWKILENNNRNHKIEKWKRTHYLWIDKESYLT